MADEALAPPPAPPPIPAASIRLPEPPGPTRPKLLNERLQVHSYDGGSQRGRAQFDIRHVLTPLADPFHSSGSGTKFNLVLESTDVFTLSHFFIAGPSARGSETIRSGLVFVSDSPPSVEESKRYDGMTSEELMEAVKAFWCGGGSPDPNLPGPCAYFLTDTTSREVEVELPKWVEGKYVLVKLLDTHGRQDHIEVGIMALVGYFGRRASEQASFGPWMRRSVRRSRVHPNMLKSMFSSGGWVCDGRDVPGGCRSGMTDFHQSSVYTMTFRCPATGFDLCEACAFDTNLGKVTVDSARADLEALRDPQKFRLACSRIKTLMKRNWLAALPKLIDGGLFEFLANAFSGHGFSSTDNAETSPTSPSQPLSVGSRVEARYMMGNGRVTSRYYPGRIVGRNDDGTFQVDYDDGDKWYHVPQDLIVASGRVTSTAGGDQSTSAMMQALRGLTLDLAQRLLGRFASGFSVSDQVWARRPGSDRWEEGRVLALPSAMPSLQKTEPQSFEGSGYYVSWRDGRQSMWVKPSDVLKTSGGGRGSMSATSGLFTEVAKGGACDSSAVSRHLQRGADLSAVDGAGSPLVLLAVEAGVSAEVLTQLLEAGACTEVSGAEGITALAQAELQVLLQSEDAMSSSADSAQEIKALLLAKGAELAGPLGVEDRFAAVRQLRDSFGSKLLAPLLTSNTASVMPAEILETLQLILQELDLKVLMQCLSPAALRSLTDLLQHFVGGVDGVKTALLGCRISRALVARKEETLLRLVQAHGVLRWARWLASRKPTGPAPTPPRSSGGLSSFLSGHQQQHHQQQLQQRASTEELALEAGNLVAEILATGTTEDWQPGGSLAEAVANVGRLHDRYSDGHTKAMHTLTVLRSFIEMDTDALGEGTFTPMDLRCDELCTAYALEKLDLPGQLLRFLQFKSPDAEASPGAALLDTDNWKCLTEVLANGAPGGLKKLVRILHAIIETGESFPVWHHRRERGLRALTEPLTVKLRHIPAPEPVGTAAPAPVSLLSEPLAPVSELRRYLLRVTPISDKKYFEWCYDIIGATIQERANSNSDFETATVLDFEVFVGDIPLPIHTIQRSGATTTQRVLLALREPMILSLPTPTSSPEKLLKVALAQLLVAAGPIAYPKLLNDLLEAAGCERVTTSEPDQAAVTVPPEASALLPVTAHAASQCDVETARKYITSEIERSSATATGLPLQRGASSTANDGAVHPHTRAHTVSLVASDEIPFDLFWPMVRDDIMGAVREACPRASFCSESAIQAGVAANGLGPLAERLTLEEAEMLAARVGHVVQTAVSVDQTAVQEVRREREKKSEGEFTPLTSRVQFQPRNGDPWTPGVVVGHGPAPPARASTPPPAGSNPRSGAATQTPTPGRPCDVIDDQGVLWEKIPPVRVHATQPSLHGSHGSHHHSSGGAGGAGRREVPEVPSMTNPPSGRQQSESGSRRDGFFAELVRLRERLRFRREEEEEPDRDEEQDHDEDEEEEDDDEEESEQQPTRLGSGMSSLASAVAAAVASDSADGASPSNEFAVSFGRPGAAARTPNEGGSGGLAGPGRGARTPSPPSLSAMFGGGNAPSISFGVRGDDVQNMEMRVLERLRALEQFLPEEFLSGPMANLQIRRGNAEGVLEIRRLFGNGMEGGGGSGGGRGGRGNAAPKPPPLRADFLAFVRASDLTSPSVSLDHPVADRLGAADLADEEILGDAAPGSPGNSQGSRTGSSNLSPPHIALKLCLLPVTPSTETTGENSMTSLPEAWNLMKAVHFLQEKSPAGGPDAVPALVQKKALVENWNLGYCLEWTGIAATADDEVKPMDVDEVACPILSQDAESSSQGGLVATAPNSSPRMAPARKRRRTAKTTGTSGSNVVARELYAAADGEARASDAAMLSKCGDNIAVANAIELLRLLEANCPDLRDDAELWTSSKLDKKLQVQLEDPLSVVSGTLPTWATTLPRLCPFLLSLDTRKKLLKYTGFGPSYALHWIQESKVGSLMQRRATVQTELNSATDPRKMQELSQELSNLEEHVVRSSNWLGTLQSTLVKVSKGDLLLRQSEVAMELLSGSGHLLEVQFDGETGFGSAVTQSFYVEVSLALQERDRNRAMPLWVEDDESSCTPYLLSRRGLLIRPLPEGSARDNAAQRFKFLGRLMGQALREGFIVPLPLTEEFFALLLGEQLGRAHLPRPGAGSAGELLGALADYVTEIEVGEREGRGALWRREQETRTDFAQRFLSEQSGGGGSAGSTATVGLDVMSSPKVDAKYRDMSIEDYLDLLGVCFLETGLGGSPLVHGGESTPVTPQNVADFVAKATNFWFDTGISAQVEAFKSGLNEILPVECLSAFRPSELRRMFCGEDRVEWDERALLAHLRPSGGLSSGSELFTHLIAILLEMDQANRARFLDFVSSCPRLPPGGIVNFHLDVFPDPCSRKGFPRSRACANQLYLPAYSSKEELRERLFEAMHCSVGHHEQKMRDH